MLVAAAISETGATRIVAAFIAAVLLAVLTLACVLVWRGSRANRRLVVDLSARTLRFEQWALMGGLALRGSTGSGLIVPFDQITGSSISANNGFEFLNISTPTGAFRVGSSFSNFLPLCAIVQTLRPHRAPWPRSSRIAFVASLVAMAAAVGLLALGAELGWW